MHSNRPFIVKDGRGAEVQVQTGTAVVKSITPDAKGNNANVEFNFDGMLKHKVAAWIPMSEPLFKQLEESLANGTEINYRLESQRRPNIPADTTFEELRKDATNTIRKLLVGVNGEYTGEAVTLAENDPMSSDRVRQQPGQRFGGEHDEPLLAGSVDPSTALSTLRAVVENKSFDQGVIDALIAQALLAGVSEEEIWTAAAGKDRRTDERRESVRPSFSPESPSWSEFNKDGRPNLGSLGIQAGVGVEKFVRSQLGANAPEQQIRIFCDLILAIADRVQEGAYGQGFRPDRSASSHSIIRGLIYDTVSELGHPLPQGRNLDAVKAWVATVGATVRDRFNVALNIADTRRKFTEIYADFTGDSPQQQAARPTPVQVQSPAPTAAEPQRPRESQSPNEKRSNDWADLPAASEPKTIGEVIEENTETATEEPESAPEAVESSSQPQSRPAPVEPAEQAPAAADEAPKPAAFGIAGLTVGVPATAKTAPARQPSYDVDEPANGSTDDEVELGDDLEVYEPVDVAEAVAAEDSDGEPAQQATRNALAKLVKQAGIVDNSKVTALLRWTFGEDFQNSADVPDDLLSNMVDQYVMAGPENFKAVVDRIAAGAE